MKSFVFASVVLLGMSGSAWGTISTYGLDCITNNNVSNCGIGEAQLAVDVVGGTTNSHLGIGIGSNQVLFVFRNAGPSNSSITDIYFDDGTLLGIASVHNSAGVVFSQGASPGNLPGGNLITPAFVTTAGFSADSDAPVQPNGVNPGEYVGILFNLISGQTYADTIAALNLGVSSPATQGSLRIGIHVQGFANGGSESFVHTPEPGFYGLLSIGLAGLYFAARRRRAA